MEELYQQLKEYQAANPTMDLTSLFENYQADRARLNMHKKALQSYKQFSFLKVKPQADKPSKISDVYEPFNFPPLNDSVSKLFVDGIQPKIANVGNNSYYSSTRQRKGRQFANYTHEDFLEAYLGKDFTGSPDLNQDPFNETFGFNERIRDMFPDEKKFLKMPKLRADRQKMKDFYGLIKEDGKFKDEAFGNFMGIGDLKKFISEFPRTMIKHPTDPKRDYMSDLAAKYDEIISKQLKRGKKFVRGYDLKVAIDGLKEEYQNDPVLYDREGSLMSARIDEFEAKLTKSLEELETKFNTMPDQPSKEEMEKEMLEYASKKYPDLYEMLMKDGNDHDHTYVSDQEEEEFEKQSMFAPTNQGKSKGKKQKQEKEKDEPVEEIFTYEKEPVVQNSRLKERQSNENLYNISHATRNNRLAVNNYDVKLIQDTADQITEKRKQMFNAMKKQ